MTARDPGLRWNLSDRELEARLTEARNYRGRSPWRVALERLRRDRVAWWSLRFLCAFAALGLLAPLLPLPSPVTMNLDRSLSAPFAPWTMFGRQGFQPDYWDLGPIDRALVSVRVKVFKTFQTGPWMGTDSMGRDLLARIVWGSRTSFVVAFLATLTSLVIGVGYGAFAGLAGGRTDNLMMRAVDVLYSIPFVFLVIFVLGVLGARDRAALDQETVLFVIIGAVWWLTMARIVRGQVLSLRESDFVRAARALGASTLRILWSHAVPNVISVVVVYLTLTIPAILLFEAFLSFLGLGVEPPKVSWGLLAVESTDAINPLATPWWLVLWPAVAMGSVLLALNLLGDGLRDVLDPRAATAPLASLPAPAPPAARSPTRSSGEGAG